MSTDVVDIWFGIANGQILSIFDRGICPPHVVVLFPDNNFNKYMYYIVIVFHQTSFSFFFMFYLKCFVSDGTFTLYMKFDENFNLRPPEVCFHTIPFHPNGKSFGFEMQLEKVYLQEWHYRILKSACSAMQSNQNL